jgi:hypothetical protein
MYNILSIGTASQSVCDALFDSRKIRIKHWNIDPTIIPLESFSYVLLTQFSFIGGFHSFP